MIGSVSEPNATRDTSRSDALIATFVGVCALLVSGYIAYMQRQQVRAAAWPILEFDTSNAPDIHNASAWKMRLPRDAKLRASWSSALGSSHNQCQPVTKRTGRFSNEFTQLAEGMGKIPRRLA